MLADINLLPKKPPKNIANHLTVILTLLGMIIGLTVIYRQARETRDDVENLTFQNVVIETEINSLERELENLEEQLDVREQQSAHYALSQTIYTTQVIAEINAHLTRGATVLNYAYTTGDNLSIRFLVDESPEVGTFVESIKQIPWVTSAHVESVTLDANAGRWVGSVSITLNRIELMNREWERDDQ